MIGISWTEMLVIGVFALIFIGPKELPAMMQRIGKVVGTIRRMGNEFQREINKTAGLDQITDLRKSITQPLQKTAADIRREFNTMSATGTQPSGVIKPADPKAESVVSEIRAAAGLEAPAAPVKSGPVMTGPSVTTAKPAAKAPRRAKPAPTAPVTTAELPLVAPKPVRKTPVKTAAKPVESPAPIEALAPAAATAKRAAPAKAVATKPAPKAAPMPAAKAPSTAKTAAAAPKLAAKAKATLKPKPGKS